MLLISWVINKILLQNKKHHKSLTHLTLWEINNLIVNKIHKKNKMQTLLTL